MFTDNKKKLARKILDFAQERELHPDYDAENNVIRFHFGTDASFDTIYFDLEIDDHHIVSMASTDLCVKESARAQFTELITRINYDRLFGCFEMDMDDGSFDFRHFIDLGSGELNDEQLDNNFRATFYVFEKYDQALLKVLLGMATAKEAYDAIPDDEDPEAVEGNESAEGSDGIGGTFRTDGTDGAVGADGTLGATGTAGTAEDSVSGAKKKLFSGIAKLMN